MLKNYFRIALRNLVKHKLYSIVNITGLTLGITACMLIGFYVWNETNYDGFHKNADRIVRVTMEFSSSGTTNSVAVTGTKVGPDFQRHFPEIAAFTRTIKGSRVITADNNVFTEDNVLFADSAFFSMFSFPLLQGDQQTCLNSPEKLVISKELANKYFGTTDVIGKPIKVANNPDMMITGIMGDIPGNSQLHFDMVMPFMNLRAAKQEEQWFTANYVTYLLLKSKENISSLQQQITTYMKDVSAKELFTEESGYLTHHLEPLKSVHLESSLVGLEPNGNKTSVYVMSVIAFLILLIACVNYTNLSVAQSSSRNVEVGIRKVLGAKKKQLVSQFLGESFIITGVGMLVSILFCALLVPWFNKLTGLSVNISILGNSSILLLMVGIVLLVSVIAGLYPALLASGAHLGMVLKSGTRISSAGGMLRKTMIVFQFTVSVVLIATTIIVTEQLRFIRNKDLGYNKDHVVVLPVDKAIKEHYEDFRNAVAAVPGIVNVTGAYETPTFIEWSDGITAENGKEKKNISVNAIPVDFAFIETMGMNLIAGRDFIKSDLLAMDTSDNYKNYQHSFILNEMAVKELGWTPSEAIGKTITKGSNGIVRGVIKNFNFSSLHENIGPLVIFLAPDFTNQLFVKIKSDNAQTSLQNLETLWKQRVAHRPFEYKFLDEEYAQMYISEHRTAGLFGLFAGLAIFLACLGLFALAAFTTVLRTKEIGIRKVLGASIPGIIFLLSKEFLVMVTIAIFIAIPISWYTGSTWLQDFAYRININGWVFISAAAIAIIIAIISVSIQAFKAAVANPVKSLRTE